MQNIKFTIVLFLTAFMFVNAGCKKYDEGPAFSLASKKARVANEWKIESAFDRETGEVTTADYAGESWEFTKNDEFIEKENGIVKRTGVWEFITDKEAILVSFPDGDLDSYTILRLKNDELWLIDFDEEYHLAPL